MADEIQIQPSSSSEILDLLLGAGLDRGQATALIGNLPQDQRSERLEDGEGQRPTTRSNPQIRSDQSSTGRTDFERTVMETMQRLSQRLDSLAERVEGNDGRNRAMMTESSPTSGSTPTLWADRPLDEPLDSLPMPQWDDQDEESAEVESRKVVQVSENTQKAIKTAFGRPLHNAARLQTRKAYPFPMTEDTKCPKLDGVVKQNLTKEIKDADSNVAKLQTLTLDAVAPLVHILEEAQRGSLTVKTAVDAAGAALALLGNASAHMTGERRKRVLRDLNKDLLPLAEDEEAFKGAAPLLFGESFERRMKDHLESLKCLRRSMAPKPGTDQFFRRGRSLYPARGGGNFRGRGGGQRYNPYQPRNRDRHFQKKDNLSKKQ